MDLPESAVRAIETIEGRLRRLLDDSRLQHIAQMARRPFRPSTSSPGPLRTISLQASTVADVRLGGGDRNAPRDTHCGCGRRDVWCCRWTGGGPRGRQVNRKYTTQQGETDTEQSKRGARVTCNRVFVRKRHVSKIECMSQGIGAISHSVADDKCRELRSTRIAADLMRLGAW